MISAGLQAAPAGVKSAPEQWSSGTDAEGTLTTGAQHPATLGVLVSEEGAKVQRLILNFPENTRAERVPPVC